MPGKHALIIGNSHYEDPTLAKLKAPEADVRGLAALLNDTAIGQFESVRAVIDESEAITRRAIANFFAQGKPNELLLLYFSGHGVLDDKGRLYLAAKDTQRDLPQATAIPAAFITDGMDSSRSRRQVLILDCCHSGAFARGARSATGAKAITEMTFEGIGYGRAVLTATDATQYAWEGEAVIGSAENSVFTHYMIEGLQSGAADTDGDGEITLEELYDYIYGNVVKQTPKQTPRKWSYNQEGRLVIARTKPAPPKVVELPDELRQAIRSPYSGVRESAVRELEILLHGDDGELALVAEQALWRLAADDSRRVSIAASDVLDKVLAERRSAQPPAAGQELPVKEGPALVPEVSVESQTDSNEPALAGPVEVLPAAQPIVDDAAPVPAEHEPLAALAQNPLSPPAPEPVSGLSDLERQVLIRSASGESLEEIAAQMSLSKAEVRSQLRHLMRKLNLNSAYDVRWHAIKMGLLPDIPITGSPTVSASTPSAVTRPSRTEAASPSETPALPPAVTRWLKAAWFPLALMSVGWGVALFVVTVLVNIAPADAYLAREWGGWLILGLSGGVVTANALRRRMRDARATPSLLIIGSWLGAALLCPPVYNRFIAIAGISQGLAGTLAVFGAVGGVATAVALYRDGHITDYRDLAIICAGWAVAWGLSAWMSLIAFSFFGDNDPWIASIIVGLTGALAGFIGGRVMLGQLKREQAES
ncbi:MAG: caspase, EACC1-associated type [Anaerolineales bacterium]